MRTTTIVLAVLAVIALMAPPVTAEITEGQATEGVGCIKIYTNPPGYAISPQCIIGYVENLIRVDRPDRG